MKELLPVPLFSRGFIVDRWRSLFMGDSSNNEVQPNSPREFRLLWRRRVLIGQREFGLD